MATSAPKSNNKSIAFRRRPTAEYTRGASMPLIKSPSKEAVSENISEMRASGYPQKQAVAASLENQRRMKRKRAKKIKSRGMISESAAKKHLGGY